METTSRPWQDIARELAQETNSDRVLELSQELNKALEEQGLDNSVPQERKLA